MEDREWINDFKLLKQVNPENPFNVPSGYFDDLESRILSFQKIKALNTGNSEGGFTVPENYFEGLEANSQSTFNLHSMVAGEEGFLVPGNYFNDLESQIMSRVSLDEVLEGSAPVFAVPEGYFTDLEQQILGKVAVEEILASPVGDFVVPDGYFDKLNKTILDKTVNVSENNRSAVIRKLIASNTFKYATAACLAMVIGGGILLSELTPSANVHNGTFLHKQLKNVPTDEIKSYLQLNVDAGDTQQTVTTGDVPVDADKLKDALQSDIDSIQ